MCAVEIIYLGEAGRVSRWEGETNETIYEGSGRGMCVNRLKRRVVEWVKVGTLRWFDPIKRMKNEELVKKVQRGKVGSLEERKTE